MHVLIYSINFHLYFPFRLWLMQILYIYSWEKKKDKRVSEIKRDLSGGR